MTNKPLEYIEIETAESVEYSVIWLHGLGASGHDFEPIVPELKLLNRPGVRFIFPHAPLKPVTINGGATMRAWFDITSLDFDSREQDTAGVLESVNSVNELVESEIERGIAAKNIVLAGFSQGGAIALQAGLTSKHQLGGIMALSTYLPMNQVAVNAISEERLSLPIFMAHGQFDDVIQIAIAERSRDVLLSKGASLEWFSYPMPHSVSAEEVADMAVWFKRLFGM